MTENTRDWKYECGKVKMQINMLWSCVWQQEILQTFPDLGVSLSPGYPTSLFLLQARWVPHSSASAALILFLPSCSPKCFSSFPIVG